MQETIKLKRVLTLPLVVFYGLGNILGAGIYVLIGKVAGHSGYYSSFAFLLASVVAAFSALTYAELSSRYPHSAGEAMYVQKAFNRPALTVLLAIMIAFAGLVSSGAIALGFAGYVKVFFDWQTEWILSLLIIVLCAIACWGIRFSVVVASLITLMEIIGLIIIIFVTFDELSFSMKDFMSVPPLDFAIMQGIFLGAFLAFYAYIGFEDMVNISQEVRNPSRVMPVAIIMALVVAAVLYALVGYVCVMTLPPADLKASEAPLALVYEEATGRKPILITVISLFAVINGALIQIIMASRILYGVSEQGWLPGLLGKLNRKTRTPVNATLLCSILILFLAWFFPVEKLARATSYIILAIFTLINISLIVIKTKTKPAGDVFTVPLAIPLIGGLLSGGFIIVQILI